MAKYQKSKIVQGLLLLRWTGDIENLTKLWYNLNKYSESRRTEKSGRKSILLR